MLYHCIDLRQENFLMRPLDNTIFQRIEEREREHPSPRKIDGERVVYATPLPIVPENFAHAVLCDLGEARPGDTKELYLDDIQPFPYRAPEIILEISFSYPTDIWNAGVLVCWHFISKFLLEPSILVSYGIFSKARACLIRTLTRRVKSRILHI
jgi:serine/threonine-protein kinase SRPK3